MKLSLRTKILGLCGIGCLMLIALAAGAISLTVAQGDLLDASIVANQALSNHQNADMMHDAVRGDVLSLELADTPEKLKEATEEVKDHTATFRGMIAANEALALPAEIRALLAAAAPNEEKYCATAEQIFAKAATDRAGALAMLAEYNALFSQVEDQPGKLTDEINAHVQSMQTASNAYRQRSLLVMTALTLIGLTALIGFGWVLSGRIARPVRATQAVLETMANGDYTTRITVTTGDEIAAMGHALNRSADAIETVLRGISQQATALDSAAGQLKNTSAGMVSGAEATASEANTAATAAEEVSSSVATVSAAATEMTASIQEIATQTGSTARIAGECLDVARQFSATIRHLDESSARIGEVVKAISAVAEQTNLLALNATIEAARAGEAGRGFAVVAGEVKALSQQTATSTTDITHKVTAIQSDAASCVESIKRISSIIENICQSTQTIASAVEEQTATTSEICRTVNQASEGGTQIAKAVVSLATSARATTDGSRRVQGAAQELADLSGSLRHLVSGMRFRASSTAA
jgi:methyl-accepting chemotaxis protein